MAIAIDANIAISWFTGSPAPLAQRALAELAEHGAIVPALWRWEVQDVLLRLEHAERLTLSAADALLELGQLPIVVDDELRSLFGNESALASRYRLRVYDAAYLELALRRGIPLASIDKELAQAAKRAGVAYA